MRGEVYRETGGRGQAEKREDGKTHVRRGGEPEREGFIEKERWGCVENEREERGVQGEREHVFALMNPAELSRLSDAALTPARPVKPASEPH